MAEDRLLRRIDEHMVRGNELMEQNREAFRDLGTVLREVNLRNERLVEELSARSERRTEAFMDEIRSHREERETMRGC